MNRELEKIKEGRDANSLPINISKTNYMVKRCFPQY